MIRVKTLALTDFKNTEYGAIDFLDNEDGSSVTGIYGQNGSGKTAVVESFKVLQALMTGSKLEKRFEDLILQGQKACKIEVAFEIDSKELDKRPLTVFEESPSYLLKTAKDCTVFYSVELSRRMSDGALSVSRESIAVSAKGLSKRTLIRHSAQHSAAIHDDEQLQVFRVLTREDQVSFDVAPAGKWRSLLAVDGKARAAFEAGEKLSNSEARSFIFSPSLTESLLFMLKARYEKLTADEDIPYSADRAYVETCVPLIKILISLRSYVFEHMQILTGIRYGAPFLNTLIVDTVNSKSTSMGASAHRVFIDLNPSDTLSHEEYESIGEVISSTNKALGALVPGLTVEMKTLGKEIGEKGEELVRVQILSNRNGRIIPFRCESDGIKKLVSIMSQLIAMYNDESALVVIDELDAGIFEYLLGELLEVLCAKGKGQLIFTAHNLRPLEMLPPKSIVFTTTNSANRYIRIKGFRPTNNLRDQYIRAINLGGQSERVYEPTSKFAIDSGFYDAGHCNDAAMDFDSIIKALANENG